MRTPWPQPCWRALLGFKPCPLQTPTARSPCSPPQSPPCARSPKKLDDISAPLPGPLSCELYLADVGTGRGLIVSVPASPLSLAGSERVNSLLCYY